MKNIPRNLEVLIKKASVDSEFRKLLMAKRSEASKTIGLELDQQEIAIINSIPEEQLFGIIEKTVVPKEHHQVFLGRAAALMLLAIGTVALAGCEPVTEGIRPDSPSKGIRPDRIEQSQINDISQNSPMVEDQENYPRLTKGIRPDRPKKE